MESTANGIEDYLMTLYLVLLALQSLMDFRFFPKLSSTVPRCGAFVSSSLLNSCKKFRRSLRWCYFVLSDDVA